jgi:hypothetical protein
VPRPPANGLVHRSRYNRRAGRNREVTRDISSPGHNGTLIASRPEMSRLMSRFVPKMSRKCPADVPLSWVVKLECNLAPGKGNHADYSLIRRGNPFPQLFLSRACFVPGEMPVFA